MKVDSDRPLAPKFVWSRAIITNPRLNKHPQFLEGETCPQFRGPDVRVIASSIRKGNIIEREDGQLCVVLSAESFHPGKGTPTTQIDMRRLSDGVKVTDRYKTTEQVERAFVEDKNFDFLYADGDGYHFMNADTYDQLQVSADSDWGSGAMASGRHEGHFVDIQLDPSRYSIAAPRYIRGSGNRTGDEGPDCLLLLQAGETRQRRACNGSTAYCGWRSDRHSDRGRRLRGAGEGLSARAGWGSAPDHAAPDKPIRHPGLP